MQDFLKRWTESERKQVILDQLSELGINMQILSNAVPKAEELDAFDLIAHIAWDQKPLTRRERVNNAKKRNYFAKYKAHTNTWNRGTMACRLDPFRPTLRD